MKVVYMKDHLEAKELEDLHRLVAEAYDVASQLDDAVDDPTFMLYLVGEICQVLIERHDMPSEYMKKIVEIVTDMNE